MLALTAADYAMLIPLTLASLTTMIVTIIAALRTSNIQRQVTPPSEPVLGGRTLAEIAEGVQVNAHAAALDAGRVRHAITDPATGLAAIHAEVKTANGVTLAALADRVEARRIEAEVAPGERTESEQHYVDELHAPTDAEGNPPPVG